MTTLHAPERPDLAAIRKSIADLRQQEKAAVRSLPKGEWMRDYERRQDRTLRSSKTIDVDVDFEIDKEDLEDLGYHHEDDCNGATVESQGVRQPLLDWHDMTHGLTLWSACTHEPCNALPIEFRQS